MTKPAPTPIPSRYFEEALEEVRRERAPINFAIAERVRVAVEQSGVMSK